MTPHFVFVVISCQESCLVFPLVSHHQYLSCFFMFKTFAGPAVRVEAAEVVTECSESGGQNTYFTKTHCMFHTDILMFG